MHRLLFLLLLCGALRLAAQEPSTGFAPAGAHPLEHFQEIWKKNPFTLKTAPAAIKKESFAKDLVLGSLVQFGEETLAVIVNTQTRERTELASGQDAANGMRLKQAKLADTREESFVEIESRGESAVLHYDESFQKQLAASSTEPAARRSESSNTVAAAAGRGSDSLRERRRRSTTPDTPQ